MNKIWKELEKDIVIHEDGRMNVVESCVLRHAKENPDKLALVFENNKRRFEYSYGRLRDEMNSFATFLKKMNVKKRSRVFIFLPKIPELYISMLGTLCHGCIPIPLFEAFQTEGLMLRLVRGNAQVLITNKELFLRLPKAIKKLLGTLRKIIVVDSLEFCRDIEKCSPRCDAELLEKKDTAVMMFTSSTAGTPVAGIELPNYGLVQQHYTAKLVLDLNKNDNYWCTAHPGWVTGTVYGILAPLSVGCTSYVYEGHFDAKTWIDFLKRNKISVLYTAPTALRMLKEELKKDDLANVKNICSVGEALDRPIFEHFLKLGIWVNDTYWQTETGAIMIANYKNNQKKYSLGKAIPGISADVHDGAIMIKPEWPAMMTGIYRHKKMYKKYFRKEWFMTKDLARKDWEGYFFFQSREDDIIKTSGERVSPLEIENALMEHHLVKEAAVIGIPDPIKGQIIKAFVKLDRRAHVTESLKQELMDFVKKNYAGHSYPKEIEFVSSFSRTNSGKIIRSVLRDKS
jgi:acetyl-CoA synthetase